jgi:phosphoserine phosphatase
MFANELEIIDGVLVNIWVKLWMVKAEYLRAIAEKEAFISIKLSPGDGANDLPMLNLAGLELLFMPNQQKKVLLVSSLGLDGVLYLLGYHDRHIDLMEELA